MCRTKLEYTSRETGHIRIGRFVDEMMIYKQTFNLEKMGTYVVDDGHLDDIGDMLHGN